MTTQIFVKKLKTIVTGYKNLKVSAAAHHLSVKLTLNKTFTLCFYKAITFIAL